VTDEAILGRVMLAFEGERVPRWMAARLHAAPAAGVTLFRAFNVRSAEQVRELSEALQREARAPLLVAADQEGGQLMALGPDATAFAGNMALGAAGDEALTERVGAAIGREARAMGVNLVYAPALDLAVEPANASLGIRSFGDDPAAVARHGAAMVRGLQSAGVAATAKHFPGLGEVVQDTHHGLGVVGASRDDLEARGLAPFRAAIAAGARVVMSAHVAVPGLTRDPTLPATLSRATMNGLLRTDLGFAGVSISDALDMRALAQGPAQSVDIIAAVRAGIDLLLCSADRRAQRRIEATLRAAAARGLFDPDDLAASAARLDDLRAWLLAAAAGGPPDVDIVGSAAHRALSRELAERALTRTDRAPDGGPPHRLELAADARILAIMPEPRDLTPADTSSMVVPGLGRALRTRFTSVDEAVVAVAPSAAEIAGLRARAGAVDAVVVGTIEAHREPAQADLVRAIAETGTRTVAVALRTPWDVATYPPGVPAICTYSILPDPLEALAAALRGEIGFPGRAPVAIGAGR
jgi:beta-N-acetylhexosaminidase